MRFFWLVDVVPFDAYDSNAAQDTNMEVNLVIVGYGANGGNHLITMNSGVLLHQEGVQDPDADATITCTKAGLFAILTKNQQGIARIQVDRDATVIEKLTNHLTDFDFFFNIVEP